MNLTQVASAISLAATRLGTDASTQVDRVNASATTTTVQLASATPEGVYLAAQVQSIAVTATTTPIALAYEIGMFVLMLRKLEDVSADDGAGVLNELFIRFFKTKTDDVVFAESIARELHKNLTDGAGLSDDQILGFFKALQDPAVVREAHAFSLTKQLTDNYAAAEHATLGLYKALVDSAGFGDHEVREFFKALSESPAAADRLAVDLAKPLTDQIAAIADSTAFELTKALDDQLFATDDIDGAASILDDQTVQFVKSMSEMVGITDLIYVVLVLLRDFSNVFGASDQLATYLSKPFADAAGASDGYIELQPNKGLFDSFGFLDQDQKTFGKPLVDNAAFTEARSFTLASVRTESARISDNGLVRNQSFCDFGYFSEDYFGSSTSF